MNKLLVALIPLVLTASCGTALVILGAGVGIGMWISDDFAEDSSGEIIINAPAESVFDALVAEARSRPGAGEFNVKEGAFRIEWVEREARIHAIVKLLPQTPDFVALKVSAAELGVRGRADIAKEIAESVAARF
jgi:hypothetical protein